VTGEPAAAGLRRSRLKRRSHRVGSTRVQGGDGELGVRDWRLIGEAAGNGLLAYPEVGFPACAGGKGSHDHTVQDHSLIGEGSGPHPFGMSVGHLANWAWLDEWRRSVSSA
jgi:hypothetical protein